MTNITIDDKTKIPLFAALGAMLIILMFAGWLWSIQAKADDGAEAKKLVGDIRLDIVEMKSDIKYIKDNTPRRK